MISVIVPVYNTEEYLHRCIDSILAQTYTDFELILIDDGSTDSSGNICDEYAETDGRIVVFHQENKGQAVARNVGLDYVFEKGNSDWIAFVDSDDWIHHNYLKILISHALEEKLKILICDFVKVTKETSPFSITDDILDFISPEQLYCTDNILSVVPYAKLFAKELWVNMRFPEGIIHEDEYVLYKILFQFDRIAYTRIPLYYYYQNPNGTVNSKWNPRRMAKLDALNQQIDYFDIKGLNDARVKAIRIYAYTVCDYISEAKKDSSNKTNVFSMRKSLKKHLKKFRKELSFKDKENKWFYETAYPIRMKYYWFIMAAKSKILRRSDIGS